jgi:1-acyl-sn-glycerol-3-phosphate acyltransferase
MSNHESFLDPPLLMGAIQVPAVYIAKRGVKWMPFVGWAAWAGGMIFVDRGNNKKAALSMARATEEVRRGKNVVIFPEGTRTKDGRIGAFKKGGFRLAADAGVPIVPLATVGGWDVLPKGALRSRPGKMQVIFGNTIYPDRYPTKEALMEEVERQIREMAASVRPAG